MSNKKNFSDYSYLRQLSYFANIETINRFLVYEISNDPEVLARIADKGW